MSPNLDPTGPASAGSPFSEAMYRYDQARDAGRVLAPEDLTSDPELQAELREAIDADQAFRRSVEPAPEADEQPPSLPGYVLHEKIGEGGMGIVYRATDRTFDREVAVKLIKRGRRAGPAAAARFRTEAGISARLEHPNIPPVYALGELPDGSPFLAMKLVRGETLDVLLKARATPADDLPRFVGVFEAVCQAVGYAHSRGVVHRDLKPHNVMVGQHGEVQVMDWGLSRELAPGSAAPDRREGSSGTPAYMAPEQAQGELAAPRADVFALGGILCAILTGEPPFRGSSALDVRARAKAADLADAVDRLNGCGADGELVTLALWCLAAEPGARPADGRAVAGQVAAYRAGVEQRLQVAQANRAAADARAVEQARRRKVIQRLAGAVAAVLLLGIGGTTVGLVLMSLAREAEASARGDAEAKRALAETAQAAEAAQKKVAEDKQAAAERAEGEKERQRKAAVEIKDFLASVLVQGDPRRATKDQGADPDRTLRAALDWAAKGIEGRFADQPEIAADLRNTIGLAYLSLGAHAAAGGHFRAALDLREQALGPSHPDTFTSVHNIAYLYRTTGDYGVAVPFLKRAVAGQEETLGPDHPETLLSVHNLAELYGVMGGPWGDRAAPEAGLGRAGKGPRARPPKHIAERSQFRLFI